ncbi:MAG TPA: trypsin-like peptidase domain-containing protein [Candidatus Nanoarchaeia archaeon]|nr:trypsin-like peptidase domain-containing protein [Candidatus Nanoarchaeia archaeon]
MSAKYSESSKQPIVHHHIVLKPHHRKLIIGGSSLVVIFMIVISVFTYMTFVRQELNYGLLNKKISDIQKSAQTQIDEMSSTLLSIQGSLEEKQQQIDLLKASAGEDFSGIIESSIPSVVIIRTDSGQGAGFIIDEDGYIVTNAHVLADESGYLATGIHAINYGGERIDLEFIGYDNELDIALLKAQGDYKALELGDSDNVKIGERVIAIGNPYGLTFSVTEGIISGIHRQGPNGLSAYIQIDAALNPGNSGGPLIDKQGNVIGMNNFKISGGENLGFALESDYIETAVNNIALEALNQTII